MMQNMQPAQTIPVAVLHLAEAHHLDTLITVSDTSKEPYALTILGMGLLVEGMIALGSLALLLVGFSLFYFSLLGVLLVSLVVWTLYRYRKERPHRHDQMVIYREGLVSIDGPAIRVLRWEQIETVYRGSLSCSDDGMEHLKDIDVLRLIGPDGVTYMIEKAHRSRQALSSHLCATICDMIENIFIERHLSEALNKYNSGGELFFGEISISLDGFKQQEEPLAWPSVVRAEVGAEWVILRKEGRTSHWYQQLLPRVPNAGLLKEVLACREQ